MTSHKAVEAYLKIYPTGYLTWVKLVRLPLFVARFVGTQSPYELGGIFGVRFSLVIGHIIVS